MDAETIGIGQRYMEFFVRNINSRYVICIGGRRSGKSWSCMRWLKLLLSGKPKKLIVLASTFPALQLAMNDWQKSTGLTVSGSILYGYSCQMANGSVVQFRNWDDPTKAQGSEADYLYCEEYLSINEEVIRVATMSVREQIYMAANPTRKSRLLDDYVDKDGHNYLKTTYKDNPFLTPEQVKEFDDIKSRSLRPNATIYDIWMAKVYCDGEFGDLVGRVFEKLEYVTYNDYLDVPAREVMFMDLAFGGTDKTCLIGAKLHQNKLYIHTYMYKQGTISSKELAWDLVDVGVNAWTPVYSDYGGVGRQIMDHLITAANGEWTEPELCNGFQIGNVIKGRIMESLMALMALDGIVLDDSSDFTREEFETAMLDEHQTLKGDKDHAIACARYAINYFHAVGV